ncbi:hypothetical protein RM533_09345 [Croceicoccus sp. F390]|uniref:Uncharacterized protein n=1 Tax=Croceicoccus esteveae TaxID=3075597 RepID=A0ABU2ZJ40_9SPHN|nr:hypothetical protein [Croceicoccus sp. F390]MDT0576391.1 hypothetical protein [Croceicoccus sp. F390]
MSRHQIPLREGVEATSAWIGWDRPLQTFYAQVFARYPNDENEEIEILWVGTSEAELPRPVDAIRLLEPYCDVPAEIAASLEIDRMKTLAKVDGPNQLEAKAFLARLEARNRSNRT